MTTGLTTTAAHMHSVKWTLSVNTAPTDRPVTLDEVKAQCRILHNDEDSLLNIYRAAATQAAEMRCQRQLMLATLVLTLDGFPEEIRLPKPPALAVSSVAYIDTAGSTQTLSTDVYGVDVLTEPGRVYLKYGQAWPATRPIPNAVTVTYTAGYSSSATIATQQAAVPAEIKLAILHIAGHWFENREPVNVGNIVSDIPMAGEALLDKYWHGFLW
jgi:uncharacterized phiE125 gp8 family phage protein